MPSAAQTPGEAAAGISPVRPFLKWAGGKGQLLAAFEAYYPRAGEIGGYVEPFLGSGAVFFHVQALLKPKRVVLSDGNAELVEAFEAVRDEVETVIELLATHKKRHTEAYYYEVRAQEPSRLRAVTDRAARLIFLNKT